MKGAGRLTLLAGCLLVLAAWVGAAAEMPPNYQDVTEVLAEILAFLTFVLAWRFRRSRLAIAAVIVALANLMLRGLPHNNGNIIDDSELAALGILLPLNLGILALFRDGKVARPATLIHLGALLAQQWLVGLLLRLAENGSIRSAWIDLMMAWQAPLTAFLIAVMVVLLAFVVRRGAFEGGLLWVLSAAVLVTFGPRETEGIVLTLTDAPLSAGGAHLILIAAQLILLFVIAEDSYRLAFHDELTGLPGRRALNEAMRSLHGEYALAMADVDKFKLFNDRYGHDAGDQVLKMVAEELAGVRGGGRAFRYGGEEFAVVFANCTPEEADRPLEVMRRAIANRRFAIRSLKRPRKKPEQKRKSKRDNQHVTVTISIGVAGPNRKRTNPDEVLKASDKALYKAKKSGRNCLVRV